MRVLAALSVTLICATSTWGQDGTSRRGIQPGERIAPRPAECKYCAKPYCSKCAPPDLESGKNLAHKTERFTVLREWGDVVSLEVRVSFRAKKNAGTIEAYTPLNISSVMAITGAAIEHQGQRLVASPEPPKLANMKYLETRRRTPRRDPLLLTQRAPGLYDLRVFPVGEQSDTTVTIRGFSLLPRAPTSIRLYRTGQRYLAVVPLDLDPNPRKAALVDKRYQRSLYFLDRKQAKRLFGRLSYAAMEVPCVPELERAVTKTGVKTWVAVPGDRVRAGRVRRDGNDRVG